MAKFLKSLFAKSKQTTSDDPPLVENLMENHACYVLITCSKPTADGKMEVEMTYEGDRILASYLVQSAQGLLDQTPDIS